MALCYLLKKAPSKAKTDVDVLLREMCARNVGLSQPAGIGKFRDLFVTFGGVLRSVFAIRRGDILVLQYNLRKYYTLMCRIAHWKGAKVVTLIHDLGSFYRSRHTPKQEIARIGHSDYLIVHNDRMKQWLLDNGCKVPMGTLEIFDYLAPTAPVRDHVPSTPYGVVYAGTLKRKKSGFLYGLGSHIRSYRFVLYGGGFEPEEAGDTTRFDYRGFVSSDKLVADPGGDFGLVWDGNSIDGCTGARGEYTRYNNPHKCSLYLRCGLPVIIWKQAVMAEFVEQHGVGITVESLEELDGALEQVSPRQYSTMQNNAREIGERLARGHYFKQALDRAVAYLQGGAE